MSKKKYIESKRKALEAKIRAIRNKAKIELGDLGEIDRLQKELDNLK